MVAARGKHLCEIHPARSGSRDGFLRQRAACTRPCRGGDQANWRNHGEIDRNTPVLDVSAQNDWSKVRVWDVGSNQFGSRIYAIKGFIGRSAAPSLGT